MLTLFDILPLFGACAGLVLGIVGGERLLGAPGAIGGAFIGCVIGVVAGRLPFVLILRMLSR